jgi:hypothetical protein
MESHAIAEKSQTMTGHVRAGDTGDEHRSYPETFPRKRFDKEPM